MSVVWGVWLTGISCWECAGTKPDRLFTSEESARAWAWEENPHGGDMALVATIEVHQ